MRHRRALEGLIIAVFTFALILAANVHARAQTPGPDPAPAAATPAVPAMVMPDVSPTPSLRRSTAAPWRPIMPARAVTPRPDLLLHSFPGSPTDGIEPRGSVLAAGNALYGRTAASKEPLQDDATAPYSGPGSLFMYTPSNRQYKVLHVFLGSPDARDSRHGSLTSADDALYGTTQNGGTFNRGAIFSWNLKTESFAVVYSFTGGLDGSEPHNGFVADARDGDILYGTAGTGGTRHRGVYMSHGTIFSFNIRTQKVATMFRFDNPALGKEPHGRLTLDKDLNVLFGMTRFGGGADKGVVYRIGTNGSGFAVLHSFAGGYNDGATSQHGRLIEIAGKLYGMTTYGGSATGKGQGVAFSMDLDGSKYTILHRFGYDGDGAQPFASFINIGNMLYGTTRNGGAHNLGTVFGMRLDGTNYTILHHFTGTPGDGAHPVDEAVPFNDYLWVLTTTGGATDRGALCAIPLY